MPLNRHIEERIQNLGAAILQEGRQSHSALQKRREAFLDRLLAQPTLKTQLLRLVDVLPALQDDRQLAEHVNLYLGSQTLPVPWPRLAHWGLHHARKGLAAHVLAAAARKITRHMALNFIAGETLDQVEPVLQRLWRKGLHFSLDVLGEASTGENAAVEFQQSYLKLIPELARRIRSWPLQTPGQSNRRLPNLHLSIKLSALYSQLRPVDPDGSVAIIKSRLRTILSAARAADACIIIDIEQFDYRAIILRVFQELLNEDEFRNYYGAGIAIQAYLQDAVEVVTKLIAWAKARGTPVTIRLVRGAYWDYERAVAQQNSWLVPVWPTKAQTDKCYEQCLELLLANFPFVRTAIATHNLRSICTGAALAEARGLSPADYEFQMLFGMADDYVRSLAARYFTVRVYTPFGPLLPGMAYFVRRLMENASNESFLKHAGAEVAPDEILAPAHPPRDNPAVYAAACPDSFANVAPRRFAIPEQHAAFAAILSRVQAAPPPVIHPIIGGEPATRHAVSTSINPSQPDKIVGRISEALVSDVQSAVAAAIKAGNHWRDLSSETRSELLDAAAQILTQQRDELSAWQILEAGKPWAEADADVCEAIDHIRYAAFQARRLFKAGNIGKGGESNAWTYHGVGPAAIIAPWNFPLAIVSGMAAAALAAGNPVVIKPAPQTPVSAYWLVQALQKAGLPAGTVGFLPGGDEIGRALVAHPDVALIAFTGSEAAGRQIIAAAMTDTPGRRHFKRVIAEMGGKNAIIVDDDADLDTSIADIVASAFSYAGQKCSACSRLIVLPAVYDQLLEKIIDAVGSLRIGDAADPSTYVGPVIDQAARDRINQAVAAARSEARLLFQAQLPNNSTGYYVAPSIFTDVPPDGMLAQEELFGPVLAVFKAKTIEHAVELANNSRYGLTGGIMSRNPRTIEFVRQRMEVGNLYVNRRITGAVVGRQPFGGIKSSGLGSKAGGPDYLLQFVQAQVVTENTIRHGFVPPET